MNLMNFQLFTESKNYQNLYHIIDFEKLRYIIENNKLSSYKAGGGYISFTRDKMMGGYLGSGPISFIKLEIDSQRLSTKYKIKPFSFRSYNGQQFDEREERVMNSVYQIQILLICYSMIWYFSNFHYLFHLIYYSVYR